MGESHRLRFIDVKAVFQLAGECRELGSDARVWQRHMLSEMCRLTGCQFGGSCLALLNGNDVANDWTTAVSVGWSDGKLDLLVEFLTCGEYPKDEFCSSVSDAFVSRRANVITRFRQQLISDTAWFRTMTHDAYRQSGAADNMMALAAIPSLDRVLSVVLMRAVGERPAGLKEARLVNLFSQLIRPYLGGGLALIGEPGIIELSRRRRQVLAELMDGASEKQVARRLGLSLPTVHQYVTDLYRHFRVSSRGELLALFLRRHCGPSRQWIQKFVVEELPP